MPGLCSDSWGRAAASQPLTPSPLGPSHWGLLTPQQVRGVGCGSKRRAWPHQRAVRSMSPKGEDPWCGPAGVPAACPPGGKHVVETGSPLLACSGRDAAELPSGAVNSERLPVGSLGARTDTRSAVHRLSVTSDPKLSTSLQPQAPPRAQGCTDVHRVLDTHGRLGALQGLRKGMPSAPGVGHTGATWAAPRGAVSDPELREPHPHLPG